MVHEQVDPRITQLCVKTLQNFMVKFEGIDTNRVIDFGVFRNFELHPYQNTPFLLLNIGLTWKSSQRSSSEIVESSFARKIRK